MNSFTENNYGNGNYPPNFSFNPNFNNNYNNSNGNNNNNGQFFSEISPPFNVNNDFNSSMNNIVRNNLKSRGISFRNDNIHNSSNNSPLVSDRKKLLLNSIQQQMGLTKNTKLQELERKRKEDEKYVLEMGTRYPFGR